MAAEAIRDPHTDVNVDSTHSPTPLTIEYPEHASANAKEAHKTEMLSAHPETLFIDRNNEGKTTNLIFFTDNQMAWYDATLEHYPDVNTKCHKLSRRIDINNTDDNKTTATFYTSGKVVVNANWKPFEKDFPKIKASAQVKKLKETADFTKIKELVQKNNTDTTESRPTPTTDHTIEPTLLTKLTECFHSLELKQVHMEQQLLQYREEQTASMASATMAQVESELQVKVKKLENSELLLKQQVKLLREHMEKEIRQLKEAMENELEILRQSKDREIAEIRESMRTDTEHPRQTAEREKGQLTGQTGSEEANHQQGESETVDNSPVEPVVSLSQESTQDTSTATPPESSQLPNQGIVLLTDSNGKYIDPKKLFPRHEVKHLRCRDTARAMELLTRENLGSPSHVLIHTGTNDIWMREDHSWSYCIRPTHELVASTKRMIEKATSTFPNAKVVISALLPRRDVESNYINAINAQISRFCAMKRNVYFAKHPELHRESLRDDVHIYKALIPTFAKKLKDVALGRDNPLSGPRRTPRGHATRQNNTTYSRPATRRPSGPPTPPMSNPTDLRTPQATHRSPTPLMAILTNSQHSSQPTRPMATPNTLPTRTYAQVVNPTVPSTHSLEQMFRDLYAAWARGTTPGM